MAALRDQLARGGGPGGQQGISQVPADRAGGGFGIDEAKVAWEARFDGKWVLQTDTELSSAELALRYKDLWMVEQSFRSVKSVLETRPIYHKCDETIRGHVFCSFLALVLMKELTGADRATRLESGVAAAPRRPGRPGRNDHSHRGAVVRGPQRHRRRGGQSDPGRRRGPRSRRSPSR